VSSTGDCPAAVLLLAATTVRRAFAQPRMPTVFVTGS
jgi:hypothetical protein